MKTIKDLTIQMTYIVSLSDVPVPNSVYKALSTCYTEGGKVPMPDECVISGRKELTAAPEWLVKNVRESDAVDWDIEIKGFE